MTTELVKYSFPLTAAVRTTENYRALLVSSDAGIDKLIPPWACLTADQLVESAAFYVATSREARALMACTGESLRGTVRDAAEIGLSFNRALGHLHMIPYGTACSLSVDYKGLVEVVYRTCDVKKVDVQVVFEGDLFEPDGGPGGRVRYVPQFSCPRNFEHATVCYAEVVLVSGETVPEFMDKTEYAPIRALSKSPVAKKWPTEHMRKSCLRRLLKRIPKRPDRQGVIAKVLQVEHGEFGLSGATLDPAESMEDRGARLAAERKQQEAGEPDTIEGEVVQPEAEGVPPSQPPQEATPPAPDPLVAALKHVGELAEMLAEQGRAKGKKTDAVKVVAYATKQALGDSLALDELSLDQTLVVREWFESQKRSEP